MKLTFDASLKGMKELDRDKFKIELTVPTIKVRKVDVGRLKKLLHSFTMDSLSKKYQNLDENDPLYASHKSMILDPESFDFDKLDMSTKEDLIKLLKEDNSRQFSDIDEKFDENSVIEKKKIMMTYEDFKFEDILKAILPESALNENISAKGYSIIGHIAHFNLRDQILDYKKIIGEVLLDKMPQIKTVVNKVNEIDNTYRNFQFEILAGAHDTNVTCKENGCEFKFDFAKVYWNPRLGTEHERVVNMLEPDDVVYDVFAGVGPFAVPAVAKRRVSAVLANDLNPESYRALVDNFARNTKSKTKRREIDTRRLIVQNTKKSSEPILASTFKFDPAQEYVAFNMDGRDFIRSKLKYHLVEMLNYRCLNEMNEVMERSRFYALMNLPAMSIEFLDAFRSLYDTAETEIVKSKLDANVLDNFRLNVYCYHFCKGELVELEKMQNLIRNDIFGDAELKIESKYVRKVAPSKDMYCSMFQLGFKHFFMNKNICSNGNIKCKLEEIVEGFYERGTKRQKTE